MPGRPATTSAPAAVLMMALFVVGPLVTILAPRALGSVPVVFAVLGLAAHLWRERSLPPIAWGSLAAVLAFVAAAALSALWAPDPGFVLERVGKLTYLATSGFVILALVTGAGPGDRDRMARALLAGTVVAAALLAIEATLGHPINAAVGALLGSAEDEIPGYATNRAALTLALLASPAVVLVARRYGPLRAAAVLAAVAAAIAAGASQSSVLALGAAAIAGLSAARYPRATILALAGLAILSLALAPWVALAIADVDLAGVPGWEAGSARARIEIWATVAGLAVERPWLGYGLEALRSLRFDAPIGEAADYTRVMHPHSGPLQIWFELGTFGVAVAMTLICLLTGALLALGDDARRTAAAVFAGVLAVLLVSHGLWQSWWIGLLGLVAAAVGLTGRAPVGARPVSAAVAVAPQPAGRRAAA